MKIKTISLYVSIFLSTAVSASSLESLEGVNDEKKQEQVESSLNEQPELNFSSLETNLIDLSKISEELNKVDGNVPLTQVKTNELDFIMKKIDVLYPYQKNLKTMESTILTDFYEVELTNQGKRERFYIHKSGQYVVPIIAKINKNGSVVDLNIEKEKQLIAKELANFSKDNVILYGEDNKRAEIYVFSDFTCPHCKSLHKSLPEIINSGVKVNYLPYPRNGINDKYAMAGLKRIICSETPTMDFDSAFENPKKFYQAVTPFNSTCEEANLVLHNNLILADRVGVSGTPYVFLSDGTLLGGWTSFRRFNEKLNFNLLNQ